MKIGIVIDQLNVGGVEKIAIEQVTALRNKKVNAKLIILKKKKLIDTTFDQLLKDVPIVYLDSRLPSILRFSFKFPVFYFFSSFHLSYPFLIPWIVKDNEFDYLFSHGTYTSFTVVAIKMIKGVHFSSFIWDPVGYILGRVYKDKFPKFILSFLLFLSRFLDSLIIRNADTVLVGGDAHNAYFKGLDEDVRIVTIPPSVDIIKRPVRQKAKYILTVTAWKRGKNPEYLIELIKKMPGISIKMAGKWIENSYRAEYVELLKRQHVEKSIEVLGGISEKGLKKLYSEASLVLQTNDDRGFGMPALEAAGNGTTFIIPRGQGVCNLFKDRIDGFFTKEKDTLQIVKYIKLLLLDRELNQRMSRHAWETVRNNYTWDKHAEKLLHVAETYAKDK